MDVPTNSSVPTPGVPPTDGQAEGTETNLRIAGRHKFKGRNVKLEKSSEKTSSIRQAALGQGSKSSVKARARTYSIEDKPEQVDIKLEKDQLNVQRPVPEMSPEEMIQDYDEAEGLTTSEKSISEAQEATSQEMSPGVKKFMEATTIPWKDDHYYNQPSNTVSYQVKNREQAQEILAKKEVGSFLFRPSNEGANFIAISVKTEGKIDHKLLEKIEVHDAKPYYKSVFQGEESNLNEQEFMLIYRSAFPLSVFIEFYEKGGNFADSGQFITPQEIERILSPQPTRQEKLTQKLIDAIKSNVPFYDKPENTICQVDRQTARKALENEKVPVGSFIFRPSSDVNFIAASIKTKDGIAHQQYEKIVGEGGVISYRSQTTENQLKDAGYTDDQIKTWHAAQPLSTFVGYWLKGGEYSDKAGNMISPQQIKTLLPPT